MRVNINHRTWAPLSMVALLVVTTVLIPVVALSRSAEAAANTATAFWVDQSHITYSLNSNPFQPPTNETFATSTTSGGVMTLNGNNHNCVAGPSKSDYMSVGQDNGNYKTATDVQVFFYINNVTTNPPLSSCATPTPVTVSLTNKYPDNKPSPFPTTATWVDQNTISYNSTTYKKISNTSLELTLGDGDFACGEAKMVVHNYTSTTPTTATVTIPNQQPCSSQPTTLTVTMTNAYPASGSSGNNGSDGCQIGGPLSWIACPVITLLGDAIGILSAALENALYIPVDQFFGSNSPVQQPFNTFRNIAVALLVVGGLVMVISEAAGFEVFAAYTIRKTLPRIVLAIIGISLAWPILKFGITLSNDLGLWMNSLIVGAFPHPSNANVTGFDQSIQGLLTILIPLGAVAAGADAIIAGSGGIVGSLLLTLLVTLFIGYLILALRQMVILVGIIIAPLAIAASILPGTHKMWDFWEDSILGALLMFPIIMAFLGAGTALSNVAQTEATAPGVGAGAAITWTIMAVFTLIGALVLVPLSFRIASGILRTAHAALTGSPLSKGFFAKQKEYRGEKRAEQRQKFLAGQRYSGALGQKVPWRGLGKFGSNVGAFMNSDDKLAYLRNKQSRQAAMDTWGGIVKGRYAKNDNTMASQYQTDMLLAQSYGEEGAARSRLASENDWFESANAKDAAGHSLTMMRNGQRAWKHEDGNYYQEGRAATADNMVAKNQLALDQKRVEGAIQKAYVNGGFGFAPQQYAADQLAFNGDYESYRQAMQTIARASNGNEELLATHVGTTRGALERSGFGYMKPGFGTGVKLATKVMNGTATDEDYNGAIIEAVRNMDNTSLSRIKSKGVPEVTKALNTALEGALKTAYDTPGVNIELRKAAAVDAGQIRAKLENVIGQASYGYASEAVQVPLMKAKEQARTLTERMDQLMGTQPTQVPGAFGQPVQGGNMTVNVQGPAPTGAPSQATVYSRAGQPVPGTVQPPQPVNVQVGGRQYAPSPGSSNTPPPILVPQSYINQQRAAAPAAGLTVNQVRDEVADVMRKEYERNRQRVMSGARQGDMEPPQPSGPEQP